MVNYDTIQDGTFGDVDNHGTIQGGTFGDVDNYGIIQGGTFGDVDNHGTIQDGTFGDVDNYGIIQGGTFGDVDNHGTIQGGDFGDMDNYGTIQDGTFGDVDNHGTIQGGAFSGIMLSNIGIIENLTAKNGFSLLGKAKQITIVDNDVNLDKSTLDNIDNIVIEKDAKLILNNISVDDIKNKISGNGSIEVYST